MADTASAFEAAGTWVRSQVEPLTDLEAYDDVHPGWDQNYDEVIVYSLNRGDDTVYSNGVRVWHTLVLVVKAIVKGNRPTRANELAGLIDTALHNKKDQPLVEGGWRVHQCLYDMPLKYVSTGEDGMIYRHSGALYEIKLREEV